MASDVQMESLVFAPIDFSPDTGHHWKEPGFVFFASIYLFSESLCPRKIKKSSTSLKLKRSAVMRYLLLPP